MKIRLILTALIIIVNSYVSSSTTLIYRTLSELVSGTNNIVVGEVLDVKSFWTPNHQYIRTSVTLNVTGVLKGSAPQTLTFTQDGGRVGDDILYVGEMPVFHVGERVILFLSSDLNELSPVYGMSQGRFNVIRDAKTGADYITTDRGDRVIGISDNGDLLTDNPVTMKQGRLMILGGTAPTWESGPESVSISKQITTAFDFIRAISSLTNVPIEQIQIPNPQHNINSQNKKNQSKIFGQSGNQKPSYLLNTYWAAATCTIMISPGQYPNGSVQYTRIKQAAFAWNNLAGSRFTFVENTSRVEKPAPSKDGTNFITRGALAPGTLGVTFWWTGGGGALDEIDLIMSTSVTWTYTNPSSCTTGSPYDFWNVAVHEFGHAWGMGHESNIAATLNPYYPGGWSGNWGHDVMSDDRNAIRVQYSSSAALPIEFFTTRWKLTGAGSGAVTNVSNAPATAAVGSDITIQYSIHLQNVTTPCKPLRVGFYLSTDDVITPSDKLMGFVYITPVDSFTTSTLTSQLTIPQTSAGSYNVGWYLDDLNLYTESDETNNGTARCAPITITSGSAPVRTISATPSPLNFGSQQLNVQSAEKTITITNASSSTKPLSGYVYLDCNVTEFTITSGNGSFYLNPGQSKNVNLTFTPALCGPRSAVLHIDHNGTNSSSPLNVTLNGIGACADIEFTSTDLAFGKVDSGQTAQKDFVFQNSLSSIQSINGNVSITQSASNQFTILSGGGAFTLAPGQSKTVSIRYKANICGNAVGELSITHSALNEPSPKTFPMTAFGSCRMVTASPAVLNFGNLEVGSQSQYQSTFVTNSPSSNDTVTIFVNCPPGGNDATNFTVHPGSCGIRHLIPGESFEVQASFKPLVDGSLTAQIIVDHNGTSKISPLPLVVDLRGVGFSIPKVPNIVIASSVDFGSVKVGKDSTRKITVTNAGNANLRIWEIGLEGGQNTDFTVTPSDSLLIPAGQSTNFTLKFIPGTSGLRATNLKFKTNDPGKQQVNIPLTGIGLAPKITLSDQQLDFGQITLGSNLMKMFDINNEGTSSLHISNIDITGANASDFAVSPLPPFDINAGQSQTIQTTFNPASLGQKTAKASVSSNAGNLVSIDFFGEAIPQPVAKISVSAVTVDFGSIQVNTSSSKQIEISNQGTANLTVNRVSITAIATTDFSTTFSTPTTLLPNQKTTVQINFDPKSVGQHSAHLNIESTDQQTPTVTVNLKGNASALPQPSIIVLETQIDFGTLILPASKKKYLVIENQGTAELSISKVQIAGSAQNEFQYTVVAPWIITAGKRDSLAIDFMPISIGNKSAQISITHNDSSKGIQNVSLTGTALNPAYLYTNPQTLDFGILDVNDPPRQRTLYVGNTGGILLNITKQQINGTDASEFQVLRLLPSSLTASMQDSAIFSLTPNAAKIGSKSAIFSIETDAPTSPVINVTLVGIVKTKTSVELVTPKIAALYQNYPNPFGSTTFSDSPWTNISFSLPSTQHVILRVYDLIGHEVRRLIDGTNLDAGGHTVSFLGSNIPTGMYIYELQTVNGTIRKTMLLSK